MSAKKTEKQNKTPDYVKRSIDRYRADKKVISILFTADQWEALNAAGITSGADAKKALLSMIKKQ